MIKDCLLKRRWIVLTVLFALVTIAISCYLIYREVYKPEEQHELLVKYKYLFNSVDDMKAQGLIQHELQPVPEADTPANDTCTVTCTDRPEYVQYDPPNDYPGSGNGPMPTQVSNITTDSPTNASTNGEPTASASRSDALKETPTIYYHGCCESYQKFETPNRLQNIQKQWRSIVQLPKHKQFFLTDVCKHAKGCNRGCDCLQQYITARVLVADDNGEEVDDDDDDVPDFKNPRLEWVRYPGWCKCFNKGS